MKRFVEECLKEWNRLGVPEATANEMAADLEVDLGEAEADGVSPEEVLGNGYFDARAFAAEWASERGLVDSSTGRLVSVPHDRFRPVLLSLSALACVVAAALGLLMVFGSHVRSAEFAVASFRHAVDPPVAGPYLRGGRFGFVGPGAPVAVLGLILLVSGVVGAGVTLWFWRTRQTRRDSSELKRRIGMPTYF